MTVEGFTLVDDYGRSTVFTGAQLIEEYTDTSDGRKPQWLELGVWRTEGGSYVVRRKTRYRIRHARSTCSRAEGYELVAATVDDTYMCPGCNTGGVRVGGFAQADRITVDVHRTAGELIAGFATDGRYNNLARAVLADLSTQVAEIDALWNTVVVA